MNPENKLGLVIEFAQKGNLKDVFKRESLAFPLRQLMACDIVQGMEYIHSQGVLHRDLKVSKML